MSSLPVALILLLAEADPTLQKAGDAIDTIDKLGKAGPVTLALVVAFGAVAFAIYTLRKNWQLREEHANELKDREKDAKEEHKKTLADVLRAAEERRNAEKELYKQMIESGIEATQALEGSNKAVEAFRGSVDGLARRLEELDRSQEKRFDELLRAINASQRGGA